MYQPKDVGHVPVIGSSRTWDCGATLDVLRVYLRTAVHVRADCRAADGADSGGNIVPATAADLMPKYTADRAADDSAGNIGATVSNDLLALDPALLPARADNGTHGHDVRRIQPLTIVWIVGIRWWSGRRRIAVVRFAAVPPDGQDPICSCPSQPGRGIARVVASRSGRDNGHLRRLPILRAGRQPKMRGR